jgi:hypothetical protein
LLRNGRKCCSLSAPARSLFIGDGTSFAIMRFMCLNRFAFFCDSPSIERIPSALSSLSSVDPFRVETREITKKEAKMESLDILRERALVRAIAQGQVEIVDRLTTRAAVIVPQSTNVIHLKDRKYAPEEVYVGRAGKGLEGPFGNPIIRSRSCIMCGKVHFHNTELVLCYERWLCRKLRDDPTFRLKVQGLAKKVLLCFCRPKNICHGDVLAAVAESLTGISTDGEADEDTPVSHRHTCPSCGERWDCACDNPDSDDEAFCLRHRN